MLRSSTLRPFSTLIMMQTIWIHGSLSGAYFWRKVLRHMDLEISQNALCIDRIGYGKAPDVSGRYNLHEELDWFDHCFEGALEDRCHMIAHSYGAYFALQWAIRNPGRIHHMILIDPLLVSVLRLPTGEEGFAEMESQYRKLESLRDQLDKATCYFVNYWNTHNTWESATESTRQELIDRFPRVLLEMELGRADHTTIERYTQAAKQWTLIVGEKTRPASRDTTRLLSETLNIQAITIAGAGHMSPATHPKQVAAAMKSTLQHHNNLNQAKREHVNISD